MRKYIVLILFIILSCQPEELMIVEPMPQYEMIFEESISNVVDGQEYSFEVSSTEPHHLIISKLNGSVVSKESIIPKQLEDAQISLTAFFTMLINNAIVRA